MSDRVTLSQQYPGEMLPVRVILLTMGQFTIIDPEDYEDVSRYKWCALKVPAKAEIAWYAVRSIPHPEGGRYANGKKRRRLLLLHTFLTGWEETDHRHRNGLDNRRGFLREVTHSQNMINAGLQAGGSSKFKGVYWDKAQEKWCTRIMVGKKRIHIGRFTNEEEAAHAYDEAAVRHFGEFARTNVMLGLLKEEK
jgi:hypothetical protein